MPELESCRLSDLLDQVASKTPTPGGGAVASAVGALAAALAGMVVAYSVGRKDLAQHDKDLREAEDALRTARAVLLALADEDAAAYGFLNGLMKLPADDPRRLRDYPGAVAAAIGVPRATIGACANLLRLFEALAPITNTRLRSDLAIAAVLAEAVARASRWNVEINLPFLTDDLERERTRDEVGATLHDAAERRRRIEAMCA